MVHLRHHWHVVKKTDCYIYQQCDYCGKRRWKLAPGWENTYSCGPLDRVWLAAGIWQEDIYLAPSERLHMFWPSELDEAKVRVRAIVQDAVTSALTYPNIPQAQHVENQNWEIDNLFWNLKTKGKEGAR